MPDAFSRPEEYEESLARGIRLSGEDRQYFIVERVRELQRTLPDDFRAHRILDYGCGTGETAPALMARFDADEVVGVDTSAEAVAWANRRNGNEQLRFVVADRLSELGPFDLCYMNGVLHHIDPRLRVDTLGTLCAVLRVGGFVGIFENNPANPGTRLVMSRIPFDRDAKLVWPGRCRRDVVRSGLVPYETRHLFFFPRPLALLRPIERALGRVPFGAQYLVLAAKN
jgi:SAM-dependent methyltransferase